ncbi:HAD hydrolase-like protein [Aquibium sp. A9E412]|uniref:HAD hydrolase-like protein n=1 Tax=Aquibium sp. A9E412 TaxID=2976767 RepID=UPI0025AF5A59|nr:HAD hydrolase-like protein [Aquibium sp. A9E412]MDN2564761.1 HAD hydrolase-like protein [Aquibium sp. A9E412]
MSGRPALLVDLDGTLTDPFVGITRSIGHALQGLGRPVPPAESLRWCIGPPLQAVFAALLDDDAAAVARAVALYRERYAAVGKFENRLIDGIPEALDTLRTSGFRLFVCTSKLESYAADIVEHFDLAQYFEGVCGSRPDGALADKAALIADVVARHALAPSEALMIGDRRHDVAGARANGLAALGVLWGFGDRAELETAGAAAIAERPPALPGAVAGLLAGAAA